MNSNLTLVQLISEQPMPNLLPILRLRPKRLIHITTPKTRSQSDHLLRAAHAAGIKPEIELVQLSDMPGISEVFEEVNQLLIQMNEADESCVVNFTGGTKLMSIGAYAAALTQKVPSLYVDGADARFVDGNTSSKMRELFDDDWSFASISNQLQVHILGIAHGTERITRGRNWQVFLPLSQYLFENRDDEECMHQALVGQNGVIKNSREPRNAHDWLRLIDTPIPVPDEIAELAVDARLVRPAGNSQILLPDNSRSALEYLDGNHVQNFHKQYFEAVAPLQQAIGFLAGGWWEIIVSDALDRSGIVRDLRWSVEIGDRDGASLEEDVVALDGANLVYVSCKRGGAKARLLPQLEEIKSRSTRIGGIFNRRFLAVLNAPRGKVMANLEKRAQELGIHILTRESVYETDFSQ